MIYNKLGNTNLTVSRLGFGLMRLPLSKCNPDFRVSTKLIHHVLDSGINFFDIGTFYCHHHCEEAFGMSVRNRRNDRIVFSGKNTMHQSGNPEWDKQLENTLKIFGVQQLDIYFIHYLSFDTWQDYFIRKQGIGKIERAKKSGLFKYLGFSSHDKPDNIIHLIDTGVFDAVLLQYNILETGNERVIEYAAAKGLGVCIMNPLAGGILADDDHLPEPYERFNLKEISFRYVFSNPNIHSIFSGMKSKNEMDENIRFLEEDPLSENDRMAIRSAMLKSWEKNSINCTNCQYCLPCPQGIQIPEIIKIWNKYKDLRKERLFSREYALLPFNASGCIGCGCCEEKCPNSIQIMKIMHDSVTKFLE